MLLHLIRHPQPIIDKGLCYGSSDLAVAEEECRKVLDQLGSRLPPHVPVYSSPLQRCVFLAEPLAASLNAGPVHYDPRLMEMHFGTWEQRPWGDLPRAEIDAWASDVVGYRPGNGENVLNVAQRVDAFSADLLQRGQSQAIVVCHAGTIRLLQARALGLAVTKMAEHAAVNAHAIAFGELLTLQL
ncbi:histidine phosphatase family protein [Herbaspirillum sp. RV1423]|uniref:histidine phosphatase family protein n=1 Tax=Herbaspirillum sp. RV1423 TaxID=1443993 RepID=UPI000556C3A9|nr:histidine phosphatase family protein [Herbaspirillum sp. RV1423]